jgi:hypothetical protein
MAHRQPAERRVEKTPETPPLRGLTREASFEGELSDIVMMHGASAGVKMKFAWGGVRGFRIRGTASPVALTQSFSAYRVP